MLQANKMQLLLLVLPLENNDLYLDLFVFRSTSFLPVAFEANGKRHSPGANGLSNNGQAQIHYEKQKH